MTTLFVVLSTQRSGSNWLEDRLDSHPEIEVRRGEVFRKTLDSDDAYSTYRRATTARRRASTVVPPLVKHRFLSTMVQTSHARVVGFRLMYDQLRRNPSLVALLGLQRARVVHLVRENLLETHISAVRVRSSGLFITRSESKRPARIELPVDDLVARLRERQALVDRHRRLLRWAPSFEAGYERYLVDPSTTDTRLLAFLGVDPTLPLTSSYVRLSEPGLDDKVTNAAAVGAALRGSDFEHLANGLGR